METAATVRSPMRITDVIDAKLAGANVAIANRFDILPVDFHHGANPFKAYIFLAHYNGTLGDVPFEFRKCYARGCPNNLCTHVSLAIKIANRYLLRDYHALTSAGIPIDESLFTLDNMVVRFEALKDSAVTFLTIPELIEMARDGKQISVAVKLDFVSAVEHFANQKRAQTYLSGELTANIGSRPYVCHRCFACFASDRANTERSAAVHVANSRLKRIYADFDLNCIDCNKVYFYT